MDLYDSSSSFLTTPVFEIYHEWNVDNYQSWRESFHDKKNMVVPFIEVEDCRYRNINAFEIVNVEWVPGGVVLKKLKISEVAKMVANYFLKNRIPF